ncbi:NAD(P)H-hydrate dehydratase [Plastorhodobacter daqingensis]|uniref:Bifunctional NAD(P)H-hydrate repair enzyme n=1 Tax=Plastorhodobacter daqingensis TaxID=1387281 RepID=A0ABW2UP60_9RHOB
MTELLTSAQMRAIEEAWIAGGHVTGGVLMERAGAAVVAAVEAHWPDLAQGAHRALVLCGPGNNGGDGFVVARLLQARGWAITLFLLGDPARLPPDAKANHDRWCAVGTVLPWPAARVETEGCSLLVDGLFGTGLVRPLQPEILAPFQPGGAGRRPPVVAIDIPSGLCADSGRVLAGGAVLRADLTVSFHRPKLGHVLDRGPWACGHLVTGDIGLDDAAGPPVAHDMMVQEAKAEPDLLRKAAAGPASHKYAHGHAVVLAGPAGRGGAARLAARGALRIGAGLVTLACPPGAIAENAARLDAIMLRPVADGPALAAFCADPRISALCLGPGLGLGAREGGLVAAALAARRPTLLDADALTLLAGDRGLFAALHGGCLLTPHAGEFARLFPDIAERLQAPAMTGPAYSKVDATRDAAARAGCTVLFKGPDTVIADPAGRVRLGAAVYGRAVPWLATAGAGDVLSGLAAGLLARGMAPFQAATQAAWLHVEAARRFGPGLTAEDLPEMLPAVLREIV